MTDIPAIPVAELKLVITDPQELSKGVAIADKGGLKHLARHANKLFADADGSGSTPYKAQITHDEKGYRGRCSCMAARSRPFCKHASALLVTWARDPSAFAVADLPPAATAGDPGASAKRTKAKTGKVDSAALMRQGVEQVLSLARELAMAGVTTIQADRVEQIRALAETLRAERLRRLSARMFELASLLSTAAVDYARLDTTEYTETLADLMLSAKRVAKHLDGDALKPEYVETLIGKSWTKMDRVTIGPLTLLEYAFLHEVTPDEYVIRESRLVDVLSGTHYSEKQILPAFLAKRTAPKRTYEGFVLENIEPGKYPGFAPHRLDLPDDLKFREMDAATLERLCEKCLPGVTTALTALVEHRKDVFAPESLPAAIRLQSLFADGERLFALDDTGESLLIGGGRELEIAITSALSEAELRMIIGDLVFLGAIPCINPLALVTERQGTLTLAPLPASGAEALIENKRRKSSAAPQRERWVDTARALGVSPAAVMLGEVREELADAVAEGLPALTPRRVEGQVERLQTLNLAKPAALLAELAQRPDPSDRLDDVIRIFQVLGLGLTRLAASRKVDRSTITRSPLHPAIETPIPPEIASADHLLSELNANQLKGHTRAVAIDRALKAFDDSTLEQLAPSLFGDGSVATLVAAAYAERPEIALEIARDILLPQGGVRRFTMRGISSFARVAKYSAIQTLRRIGSRPALELLGEYLRRESADPTLKRLARTALDPQAARSIPEAVIAKLSAANRDDRSAALDELARAGAIEALPRARRLAATDPSEPVRHRAWYTQAGLMDVDAVPLWVAALERRKLDETAAREAIHALGHIGDHRGIPGLLDAFEEGYKPTLIAEALRSFGPPILPALLDRVDANLELAARKAAQQIVKELDPAAVRESVCARLGQCGSADFVQRALGYLKLVSLNKAMKAEIASDLESLAKAHALEAKAESELRRGIARAKESDKKG